MNPTEQDRPKGVLLPSYTPRWLPLLKGVAAVTLFAFTFTSIIPAGYAQQQRAPAVEKEHLRGLQGDEAKPIQADLEDALLGPNLTAGLGGVSRRDFLKAGAAGFSTTVAFWAGISTEQLMAQARPARKPVGALAPLVERLGADRDVDIVVWDPADILRLPEFFNRSIQSGATTVWISGFRFLQRTEREQQAILNQAQTAGLRNLGFIDGNYDWVQQGKFVENHYSRLTTVLRRLRLGDLRIKFGADIEPYTRPKETGWNGDLTGYSTLLAQTVLPPIRAFAKERPKNVPPSLLTRFEPFWYRNGHTTEGGQKIGGLREITGTTIAGMTYRNTSEGILEVSRDLRARVRADQKLSLRFLIGTETLPAGEVGGERVTFAGREGQIPAQLIGVYDGLSKEDQMVLGGVFIHFRSPVQADRVIRDWLAAKPEPAPRPAEQAKEFGIRNNQATLPAPTFWANRAGASTPAVGLEETTSKAGVSRRTALKVGAVAVATGIVGTINQTSSQQANPDAVPSAPVSAAPVAASKTNPRPLIGADIEIKKTGQKLSVIAKGDRSDRVISSPTLESRHALIATWQKTKSNLEWARQRLTSFLKGTNGVQNWFAVRSHKRSIIPANHKNAIIPINDFRAFMDQGMDRVRDILKAIRLSAKAQGSTVSIAVDIGGFVDNRDYSDLPTPISQTMIERYLKPFMEEAQDNTIQEIRVFAYSSDRGMMSDVGSYTRELQDALNTGFNREAIVTDWEWWASAPGVENGWELLSREEKKQRAVLWLGAHQELLDRVISENEIPVTEDGKPTQIYALVNPEFSELLTEALKDRKLSLPERLQLVVMAYDTPQGKEAFAAAAAVRKVSKSIDRPAGVAVNLESDVNPRLTLNGAAMKGEAGPLIQRIAREVNADDQPLFISLPTHLELSSLLESGRVMPSLPDQQVEMIQGTTADLTRSAVGTPTEVPELLRRFRPEPETLSEIAQRTVVVPIAKGLSFGTVGLGAPLGAPWRNLNAWLGKGVWWFLDPDTFIWGPEAGLTVSGLRKVMGTFVNGELEVTAMQLELTPVDEKGNPTGPALPEIDVFGKPDPVRDLKGDRYAAQLLVKVRRPGERLREPNKDGWTAITSASIEVEVALGYPGYGRTPLTKSAPVKIPLDPLRQGKGASVKIDLGQITPAISFFILKSRDPDEKITGWVGPINSLFMAQHTDYLLRQYEKKWAHLQTLLSQSDTSPDLREEARREMEKMGAHVTDLQLAMDHRGDAIVPMNIEEYDGDKDAMRAHLQRLRRHGVTQLSIQVPNLEKNADRFLGDFIDLDITGLDPENAEELLNHQSDRFRQMIEMAHEAGLNVGLQLDGAELDRLTDPARSQRAKDRSQKNNFTKQSHGLEILRLIVKANEQFGFQMDFFNLYLHKTGDLSRARADFKTLREDIQKTMNMLDALLIETGDIGGSPTEWSQYASRVSARDVAPDQAREILEAKGPDLVQKARHRFPRALFIEGESVDKILEVLDGRFPSLADKTGRLDRAVLTRLMERIKVPSVTALRAVEVPEDQIEKIRSRALTLNEEKLAEALKNHEDWARFIVLGRAWEISQAQEIILQRYQNPLDAAILSAHNIQQTSLITMGDTHPFLSLKTLPIQQVAEGSAAVRVSVRNEGNLPAQYAVTLHLMGEDESGRPAWPLDSPRIEQFTKEVILNPGESQEVEFNIHGSAVNSTARVNYRVLVRDVNTLLHKPGQKMGLDLDEEAFARAEGSLLVTPPKRQITVVEQFNSVQEKFDQTETLRRNRTGEQETDPAYSQGFARRYGEYMSAFIPHLTEDVFNSMAQKFEISESHRRQQTQEQETNPEYARGYTQRYLEHMSGFQPYYEMSIDESGAVPKPVFKRRAVTLGQHMEDVRQEQRGKPKVVSLIPDQNELATARWLRHLLGFAATSTLAVGAVAAVRHATSTARLSWQEARARSELRANARKNGQPVGAFGEIMDMGHEWSHFVAGMGAHWTERLAGLHPEQGKVARAMQAYHRVTVGLRENLQEEGLPGVSHARTRLERLRSVAPKLLTAALAAVVALAALKVVTLLTAGLMIAGIAMAVGVLILPVRGPPLQRAVAQVIFTPVDWVRREGLNRAFVITGPVIFLVSAAALLLWAGTSVGLVITASLLTRVALVAGFWAVLWTIEGWRVSPFHGLGFVWRIVGAFGIGATGLALLLLGSGLSTVWFWVWAGFVFFTIVTATRLFTAHSSPLSAYADWAYSRSFLVRWAITGLVIYLGYSLAAAAFVSIGAALAATVPVLGIILTGAALTQWLVFGVVGFVLIFYVLGVRHEFMGRTRPAVRWISTAVVSAALALAIPWLLVHIAAFFSLSVPVTWASYLFGIGMFSSSIGNMGKALEYLWDKFHSNRPASMPRSVVLFRAVFRGIVLGLGVDILLPLVLISVLGVSAGTLGVVMFVAAVVLPVVVVLFALWDLAAPLRSWLRDLFEREDLLRYQFREVEDQLNYLLAHQRPDTKRPDTNRDLLMRAFQIRRAPDQLPLADYDAVLLQQAWTAAHKRTQGDFHHGLDEQFPEFQQGQNVLTPAQQMVALTSDQQRVLNQYYWWKMAMRKADEEVRQQISQQFGAPQFEKEYKQFSALHTLPLADQEMVVASYFNRYMIQKRDTILNQDEGTTLRSFGGFVWTSDLNHMVVRLREDDSIAVVMPALILSLEYAMDGPSIFGWAQIRSAISNYGPLGAIAVTVTMFAQVILMNIAVPLGFIASMVNRWGRGKVQGGNVLHTLRTSADAGMEGYQKAFWYVILVLGRWLQGLLFTLMEVYLGRWVGRHSLEEYQAARVFEGAGTGSLSERVWELLSEDNLHSRVIAHYAGLIGEDNSLFDMGHFSFPHELTQVPWMFRNDGPGVTDDDAFGTGAQPPGALEWRTEGGIGGGPARFPTRYEIVDLLDLSSAGLEEGVVLERLANGLVRTRNRKNELRYLILLNEDQRDRLNKQLEENNGDWKKTAQFFSSEKQRLTFVLKQFQKQVEKLERKKASPEQLKGPQAALGASKKSLELVSPIADGLISEKGRYFYALRTEAGTQVFVNGKDQETTLVENRQRRLSSERGKFHVVAPRGRTKGENAGAGLLYLLGMVETRVQLYRDGNNIRARLLFESTEQRLYPELEGARHAVQDHHDRLHGERPESGEEAAPQILVDNDARLRRETGKTAVSDIPAIEAGHNQVRDGSGQRFQWFMNFFRTILEWERGNPSLHDLTRWQGWATLTLQIALFAAALYLVFSVGTVGLTAGPIVGILVALTVLSSQLNFWWTVKILLGLAALFNVWPWGMALAILFPTFAAHLWGIIYPIGFIGNVQKNRLQGLRGHYQAEMVYSSLDRLEGAVGSSHMAAVAQDPEYDAQVRRGSDAIHRSDNLQLIAHLYHRVIGSEELNVQRSWRNPMAWVPGLRHLPLTAMPFLSRFTRVEPRLAQAIMQAAQAAQVPGVHPADMSQTSVLGLPVLRDSLLGWPVTRLWARRTLEEAIVRALNRLPNNDQRREVFEALKWRAVGELLVVGNRAIATQYHRSRHPDVIRMGDVNSQFGVEGQERLTRMMATQQRVNNIVVNGAYPVQGDRSWTRHSPAAVYGGIPPPSMMYSRVDPLSLLGRLVAGAQNGGFLVEGMEIVEIVPDEESTKKVAERILQIESDYLLNDYGNSKSPDRGRGLLILAHEGGALSDEQFEEGLRLADTVEYEAEMRQVSKEEDRVKEVGKAINTFLKNKLGLKGLVVHGGVITVDKKTGKEIFEPKSAGDITKIDDIAKNRKKAKAAERVSRVDPLTAALDNKPANQSFGDYFLSQTHLQPDLEVLDEYQRAESRDISSHINAGTQARQINDYQQQRELREGRPGTILRMTDLENQVDFHALGFSGPDLQSALAQLQSSIHETGTISLTAPRGIVGWMMDLFNLRREPYSREAILLSMIYGITEDQVIRHPVTNRIVGLNWTNLDSHFDASEWRFAVGPYLWPGSTMGRIALWMRRGKMHMAPPIPLVEALRLLEMPPWLAVASGFNRLPTDAFSLPQLLTEDGRHGSLNRLMPTLNPTMNAWNMHKALFMMYQLYLRKGDKSTQRALQYFVGMAIDQSFNHLFDHPIFASMPADDKQDVQRVSRKSFGLQALLRDELATAGARGAGTFSYGLSGYTGSWLAGARVGPIPPGHVAAYWAYRQYQELDQRWDGLFNAVTRQAQREAQFELDGTTLSGDSSVTAMYHSHLVDPWYVLSEAGALIEHRRQRLNPGTPPLGVGRAAAIHPAAELARQQLAQPVNAPILGLEETGAPPVIPEMSNRGSGMTTESVVQEIRAEVISATGLEEIQLGEPQAWADSAALGQVIPVSVTGEGRASSGRAVVFDPTQVYIRQIVNPDVTGGAWDWTSIKTRPKTEQPGRPLSDLVRDPQQWGAVEVPAGARLGLAMHSFQTNFWEPQGFLVTQGHLVALPGVTWSREPEVFVLDAGQPGLRKLALESGIPNTRGIQEAVVGPVLVRDGKDVSAEIRQYPPDAPDPSAVPWDPRATAAAFSALARTARGRLIFLSLVGEPQTGLRQATVGDVAQAILAVGTEDDPVVEGMLLGGSMDVQQWVAGDGEKPGVLGRHNNAPHESERPLNAAILVFAAGLEQVTTAGTELRSPVTETGDIPAQSTRLGPLENLPETRVVVVSAQAAAGTGLEEVAGRFLEIGNNRLLVLPPGAGLEEVSSWMTTLLAVSPSVVVLLGDKADFSRVMAMLDGLVPMEVVARKGTAWLELVWQIVANLTGLEEDLISAGQLDAVVEALGIGSQT